MSILFAKPKKLFNPAIAILGMVLILTGLFNLTGMFKNDNTNSAANSLILWAPEVQAQSNCTITISPSDSISSAISQIQPGQTLCLNDGTYNQSLSISKSGTASQPITIKAVNDGQVTIDGQDARRPGTISGNYIVVEGIVFRNSSGSVVVVTGDNNQIKRCSVYNANPNSNVHRFEITGDNNLFEDCAASGTGRYGFLVYDARYNILRRCFVDWGGHSGGSPKAAFSNYGATDNLIENGIGTHVIPVQSDSSEYYGIYQTWASSYNKYETNHNKYYGNILYNNSGGMRINPGGSYTTIFDSVFFDHNKSGADCGYPPDYCGHGARSNDQDNLVVQNSTFINNRLSGLSVAGDFRQVINSLFITSNPALSGNGIHEYCNFYDISDLGTTLNSTDLQINPNFDTAKYGQGAYLFSPPALQDKGKNGADIGANVLYRYRNGELTNEPLWEWPMEERICNETGISVTWENSNQISAKTGQRCTGGFWKTLDGIYGSQPAVPNLALSKSASPLSATPGQTIIYTIHYHNTGQAVADEVVITDIIPAGVMLDQDSIQASHSSAQCSLSNNTLTCNYPTIPAGASGDIRFEARVE